MLLLISQWEKIRDHFTEAEKEVLNKAIAGETICPRGCIVDEDRAGSLAQKIKSLLGKP